MDMKKRFIHFLGGVLAIGIITLPLHRAAAYEAAPVSNGAALTGKVTFKGTVPPPKVFKIQKNPEVCGKNANSTPDGNRNLYEVTAKGGALQDVVIVIEGIEKGKAFDFDGANFQARLCQFSPYVTVGVKNKPFRVENFDDVIHNPHSYEIRGKARLTLFNMPLPEKGAKLDKPLPGRVKGDVVKLECDQHDFMHNWVKVVENPYYAVVGDDGTFKIDEIPPGKYEVTAWHPILGEQEKKEVTFTAGGKNALNFEFSAQ